MRRITYLICFLSIHVLFGQQYQVSGKVYLDDSLTAVEGATVFIPSTDIYVITGADGSYKLLLDKGQWRIEAFLLGSAVDGKTVKVGGPVELNFYLGEMVRSLENVEVADRRERTSGISRLNAIEGTSIFEAKKNELILLDDFAANKVNNNARQIFAKVPGLNIWESDYAGLQLDIAARGLGPSRTANFNTRQNGYDMSADALGYPESYYMPAMQAVERIEIVRGAASLQYGTQFGGMLNFKLKEVKGKPFSFSFDHSFGSFGLINTFASAGGETRNVSYYGYYQYRQGNGWRPNSGFNSHTAFGRVEYTFSEKLSWDIQYSHMQYDAQQPGGLTDDNFEAGQLNISRRNRNWFQVNWNLLASNLDYKVSRSARLNIRGFLLHSGRDALGNLEQIDRPDNPNMNRTLITDEFNNFGTEARWLQYYSLFKNQSAFVMGARYYRGLTDRRQGDANSSTAPDFFLLNPEDPENFDYDFPSENIALFSENIININDQLSVTPGIRFEYIRTDATGTWKQTIRDFAGNIQTQNVFEENRSVTRSFVLLGLGGSYYLNENLNLYLNFSENYRSVTFSDLRLSNPNFILDSLISDESGFNSDIGIRGEVLPFLKLDVSLFWLEYNDRIGILLPAGSTTLLRTNVGDSRHMGIESYTEVDILKSLGLGDSNQQLVLFNNFSLIDATYTRSRDNAIAGNKVEYVPGVMLRSGINYAVNDLKVSAQWSFVDEQYADATNSVFNPNALTGIVPSYHVMDLSAEYGYGIFRVSAGVNNLLNASYFTRRAESYPGPGIMPATPRSFYFSLGITL